MQNRVSKSLNRIRLQSVLLSLNSRLSLLSRSLTHPRNRNRKCPTKSKSKPRHLDALLNVCDSILGSRLLLLISGFRLLLFILQIFELDVSTSITQSLADFQAILRQQQQ
ncbi:hypothetical protein CCACVL1_08780 [Corchorus capsularis]|uniref:Uncharacterized protein n=1 Tax=Corchorus capsularis TaxID=210143 RepID=A0A1R3IYW4_COCAP|nr:hypothetical protein CCACVL1_08780 [Corchorus capsularis]